MVLTRLSTVILVFLALAIVPTNALSAPRDVTSTHAYLRANYAFARASEARVAAAQTKIEALNRTLGQQCARVGVGSPENALAQHMSYEVAVALWSITYGIDAGPIRTFADAVDRLTWSNAKLTRIAHKYASDLQELAALQMPDLCGDVRAWTASGFKTVPTITAQLDQRVEAIEPQLLAPRLLTPYELAGDRGIVASTNRLETKLQDTETVTGFNDWEQILETLGLNQ
jgi:hypothetical protein